ncbi:hypothetical protein ACJMK2_009868 [Sinanodonta woodiana]|uniref:THD domain-containing protein n=1 Tax=Sinanodonta woodiana TaxID=1069815 RepID=A0ABD3VDJ4_SINWO
MRQNDNADYQEGSRDRCLEPDLELDGSENKHCPVTWKKLVVVSTLIPLFVSSLVNVAVQLLVKEKATVQVSRDVDIVDSAQDPAAYSLQEISPGEKFLSPEGLVNVFLDAKKFNESFSLDNQTKIPWDATKKGTFISKDIHYSSSSRHFQVTISGMYELTAKLAFWYHETAPRDTILYSTLLQNATQITLDRFAFSSGVKTNFYHVHHDIGYLLQAGDTVSVTASNDAVKSLDPRWRASYFGIRLIQRM